MPPGLERPCRALHAPPRLLYFALHSSFPADVNLTFPPARSPPFTRSFLHRGHISRECPDAALKLAALKQYEDDMTPTFIYISNLDHRMGKVKNAPPLAPTPPPQPPPPNADSTEHPAQF